MSHKLNLVRVLTSATGAGTSITLGAAYSQSFMTPAEAGAIDARTYTYLISDGNNWEIGRGAYGAAGTTLARTTVLASRSGGTLGTSRISLSGSAQVRFTELAEDMDGLRGTRSVTGTSDVITNADLGYAITYSNASAIAATIAQAGVSNQFLDGWSCWVKNTGAGALTITPATSTINGGSSLVLAQNLGAMIWSDGSNYHAFVMPITKPLLAANNLSDLTSAATARSNLGISPVSLAKSANYTLIASDFGALIKLTSSGTLSLTAAATLGDGFECHLTNTGTGVWTIDPNSSEQIDGASTIRLSPKQSCTLRCDGTGFYTRGLSKRTLLGSVVASNSSTVDLTCYSGYDYYEIEAFGVAPATDNVDLQMRVSSDNGANYDAGTDQYIAEVISANGSTLSALTQGTTGWYLAASQDVTGVVAGQFDCVLFPGDGVRRPSAKGEFGFFTNTPGNLGIRKFFGFRQDLVITTNVRFVYSSGNIATGTFAIYGVQVS